VTGVRAWQFVAHAFAPAGGPGADAAWRAMGEIWGGCGPLFGMTAPVTGTGLPADFPGRAAAHRALAPGGEVPLAARQRPGTMCQAVLRLHHDVLNLSVGMTPPQAAAAQDEDEDEDQDQDQDWWRNLDYQWNLLTGRNPGALLGEARLFLAETGAGAPVRAADPALYASLSPLLPPPGGTDGHPAGRRPAAAVSPAGVPFPDGFTVWETGARDDERATRQLLVAIAPGADPAASAWAWSDSTAAIPPAARYLLHAAKVRYELRVWRRDSQAYQLRESLDTLAAELRKDSASDPATRELFRLRRIDAVAQHADLLAMRRTVEIAGDNLDRSRALSENPVPGSLFADDRALAQSLAERLGDEAGYLSIAIDQAARLDALLPATVPAPAPPSGDGKETVPGAGRKRAEDDRARNVLVVYGRDAQARQAVSDFLRSLGLRPLEWEALVRETGKAAPFLSEAVRTGLDLATAVVVLLTPEDIVRLHPELHDPADGDQEREAMQARPNVFIELGMALAAKPTATLILVVGEHRPATDLGGMSYVRLTGSTECRKRIADRLRVAGCAVDDTGTDWLTAGDFAGLAAQRRRP
jgi:predicted nucleotide-binding protein